MTRKLYPYSLRSEDAKIAGVCSTLGNAIGIDPTFLRIGFIAFGLFQGFQYALIIYAALGIFLLARKKRAAASRSGNEFDRMDGPSKRRPSTKTMRESFDTNDRRMMAIDHHLNSQNDELAREIEALRREDK